MFSVRCFEKSLRLAGNVGRDQKLTIVKGRRGAFDFDDDILLEDEDEEEGMEPEYDPNLDLDRIEAKTVRLLDEEGNMVGVFPLREAIRKADNSGLILMVVSAESNPPVLRLFQEGNYQKFKFERQKKKRNQQRKQGVRAKEVKLGYNIDGHDYSVRQKQATKFLKEGRKVKVMVTLRGREHEYRDQAIELLRQFQKDLGQLASEESTNFVEKIMYIVLMPNKATIQREQQQKQREEELKKKQVEANAEEQQKNQEDEASDNENQENVASDNENQEDVASDNENQEGEASNNTEEIPANV